MTMSRRFFWFSLAFLNVFLIVALGHLVLPASPEQDTARLLFCFLLGLGNGIFVLSRALQ